MTSYINASDYTVTLPSGISEDAPDLPVPATPEFRGTYSSGMVRDMHMQYHNIGVDCMPPSAPYLTLHNYPP